MKRIRLLILYLSFTVTDVAFAQQLRQPVTFHIYSSHTSFPDTGRSGGHIYNGVLYRAADHYNDSSVLIVVPKNLNVEKQVDLVFWFHGWGNNIDSAAVRYELIKQFMLSKRNAVLVLPETARNAPDSYGGKLEKSGAFSSLATDVLNGLKARQLVPPTCVPGHILLGGHSGAYRVMARIIQKGQLPIDEAMLFDALYAETDIFLNWLRADASHRFIHLYTDDGGTADESHSMTKLLTSQQLAFAEMEETGLAPAALRRNRVLFIHSLKAHNDIVNPDNFRLFLENSPFLKDVNNP